MVKCGTQKYFADPVQHSKRGPVGLDLSQVILDGCFLFSTGDSLCILIKNRQIPLICYQGVLKAFTCDLKIDLIIFDPYHVKLIFLTLSIAKLLDILIFDIVY